MLRLLAAAACAVIFLAKPVLAEEPNCKSLDEVRVLAASNNMALVVLTERAQIQTASDFYNAYPPVTSVPYTMAAFALGPEMGVFLLGQDGRYCVAEPMPRPMLNKLIEKITGVAS